MLTRVDAGMVVGCKEGVNDGSVKKIGRCGNGAVRGIDFTLWIARRIEGEY